jgi:rare lipoprotein A
MYILNRPASWAVSTVVSACLFTSSSMPGFAAQFGKASWYALTSKTASGEWANPDAMTAAHRSLVFGTRIRVTNLGNERSVILCVNDRGPFVKNRIVDVTKAAARELGFEQAGLTKVRVDVVGQKSGRCS